MKPCNDSGSVLDDIQNSLKSILYAQVLIGKEMLTLGSGVTRAAKDGMRNVKIPGLPKMKSCCDIPEPCWMPLSLGEAKCDLQPGSKGEICFVVTNGDFNAHQYAMQAAGKDAGLVTFSQSQFQLGPKERICITATLSAPKEEGRDPQNCCCNEIEALVWVRGCRDHYLRWIGNIAKKDDCRCREVQVDDNPDYVLHWYDHFYINRSCFGSSAANGK